MGRLLGHIPGLTRLANASSRNLLTLVHILGKPFEVMVEPKVLGRRLDMCECGSVRIEDLSAIQSEDCLLFLS